MSGETIPFATVEEALEEIRQGRQIVLVDDEDRENEGDLTMAAEKITPEADQLHGQARPRPGVPGAHRGSLRRTRAPADDAGEHLQLRHGVYRIDRRAARHHHRNQHFRPRHDHPRGDRRRRRARRIWRVPDTSFPCAPATAACSCARDKPRRRWTWRASPG